MAHNWHKPILNVDPAAYLLWALSALIVPARWLFAWAAATVVHELGHYLSLRIFGVEVFEIKITCCGILMRSRPLTHMQHAICSFAGPFAGLILLPVSRGYPIWATCLFVQSVFNLLPVYPLDGGVVLYELLAQFLSESVAGRCVHAFSNVVRYSVVILMILIGVQLKSILLFAVVITIFLFRTGSVKFPCKPSKVIVQ